VHSAELLSVDSHITRIFPLLPFLRSLHLLPEMLLSNRALFALQCKDGIGELRSLRGLKVSVAGGHASVQPFVPSVDTVISLLRHCPRLEQLEIVCMDTVNPELESAIDLDLSFLQDEEQAGSLPPPLHLPYLKSLWLSAIPICPLFLILLRTPLPALRHLALTPCGERHASQLRMLLAVHGRNLVSLRINTPQYSLTSAGDPLPSPVLTSCPELHCLSLDYPLLVLTLPAPAQGISPHPHPLRVLTIPRPSAYFLREVEVLLPRLPALTVVRARSVRWLRAGVSGKAHETGVQGEMHEWRRRFLRRGVRLVDGEWRDPE
jgi:hypothetical protein